MIPFTGDDGLRAYRAPVARERASWWRALWLVLIAVGLGLAL